MVLASNLVGSGSVNSDLGRFKRTLPPPTSLKPCDRVFGGLGGPA